MGYCDKENAKDLSSAIFLVLMICSFSIIGKEFSTAQDFLQLEQNILLLWKFSACLKSILKIFEITRDSGLTLQIVDAIMNLAPIGGLWSLGSQ